MSAPQASSWRVIACNSAPGTRGLFKQCAAAAGKQKQHGIGRGKVGSHIQHSLRCRKGVFIRHGMPGLQAANPRQIGRYMTVLCHNNSLRRRRGQTLQCGVCHLPPGLADRNQKHTPGKGRTLQDAAYRGIRLDGIYGGGDDMHRIFVKIWFHKGFSIHRQKPVVFAAGFTAGISDRSESRSDTHNTGQWRCGPFARPHGCAATAEFPVPRRSWERAHLRNERSPEHCSDP